MQHICIIDFETGGVLPEHPNIQLAAIAVDENGAEVDSFNSKIAFDPKLCEPEALEMNHYTPEAWEGAPSADQVFVSFCEFLGRHKTMEMVSKRTGRPYNVARLAAFNIQFDKDRLWAMADSRFVPAHPLGLCILNRAMWWALETGAVLENFKLPTVAHALGIPTAGAHDALFDVRMAAEVMRRIRFTHDTSMNYPLPKEPSIP